MRKKGLFLGITLTLSICSVNAQKDIHPLPNNLQRCKVEHGETVVLVRLQETTVVPPAGYSKKRNQKRQIQAVRAVKQSQPLAKNETKQNTRNL